MRHSLQKSIGLLVKDLRQQKNITQKELAKMLRTSQSAVARIEAGGQNLSTELLERISQALHTTLVKASGSMDFRITGRTRLYGEIVTNTSKNGALAIMAASLINRGTTVMHGVPSIEEVFRFLEILESIGVKVERRAEKTLALMPPKNLNLNNCNTVAIKKVRSGLMLLGPLLHTERRVVLPTPGGCKMGNRTLGAHQYALEDLGVRFLDVSKQLSVSVTDKSLHAADIVMYETSDTATINALLAAARIAGTTNISFASPNYQVQEVCFFLQSLGIEIQGVGTTELTISGRKTINQNVEYHLAEDPIESMLFIAAAATTNSGLHIRRCPIDFLKLELLKLEKMGLRFRKSQVYLAKNSNTKLVDIEIKPSKLRAPPDKLHAQAYPGINVDNLPFFAPIATQASGTSLIHDWMWENRAIYFTELNRLGANVTLLDPHRVLVQGSTPLHAAQIVCPPALRPAAIIFIAMLAADGQSTLRNVYSLNRGYEDMAKRLNSIGANIQILTNE